MQTLHAINWQNELIAAAAEKERVAHEKKQAAIVAAKLCDIRFDLFVFYNSGCFYRYLSFLKEAFMVNKLLFILLIWIFQCFSANKMGIGLDIENILNSNSLYTPSTSLRIPINIQSNLLIEPLFGMSIQAYNDTGDDFSRHTNLSIGSGIYYKKNISPISIAYLGPRFLINWSNNHRQYPIGPDRVFDTTINNVKYNFAFVSGAEMYILEKLSLSGEFGLVYEYHKNGSWRYDTISTFLGLVFRFYIF